MQTNRKSRREPVLLSARCRRSSWIISHVELGNISEGGCCILGQSADLAEDDIVTLRFAGLKGIEGTVRWIDADRAGVAFIEPLPDETVTLLANAYNAIRSDVIDIRRSLRRRAAPSSIAAGR